MSATLFNEEDPGDDEDSDGVDDGCQVSHNPPVRREDKKTEHERRRQKVLEAHSKQSASMKEDRLRNREVLR